MDNDHSVKPAGRTVEQRLTDVEKWMKEAKEDMKTFATKADPAPINEALKDIQSRLPK